MHIIRSENLGRRLASARIGCMGLRKTLQDSFFYAGDSTFGNFFSFFPLFIFWIRNTLRQSQILNPVFLCNIFGTRKNGLRKNGPRKNGPRKKWSKEKWVQRNSPREKWSPVPRQSYVTALRYTQTQQYGPRWTHSTNSE